MDFKGQIQGEERERRIADFAFAGIIAAISGSMGQSMPADENARELVRLGRAIYSEIDEPTDPPTDTEPRTPPGERHVPRWDDGLWEGEEETP